MSWNGQKWDHIGQGCETCAGAESKEAMCAIGRAEYEEYIRSIIGDEAFEEIETKKAELRRRTAEDDAAHPEWKLVKEFSYGSSGVVWGGLWQHVDGRQVAVGATGRPWLMEPA